ncbi:hypothetical protein ACFSUK_33710 [Sphingobium scionense]
MDGRVGGGERNNALARKSPIIEVERTELEALPQDRRACRFTDGNRVTMGRDCTHGWQGDRPVIRVMRLQSDGHIRVHGHGPRLEDQSRDIERKTFSLRGIFLQPGIAKEFCRPASCHEDAIISAYGLSI